MNKKYSDFGNRLMDDARDKTFLIWWIWDKYLKNKLYMFEKNI